MMCLPSLQIAPPFRSLARILWLLLVLKGEFDGLHGILGEVA